jgi:arabinose-5-phosphate isomerase
MTEDSPDSRAQILERGKSVLSKEASEIQSCAERLDQSFVDVVSLLNECKGRVIASGLGKSGHIARKFSVTLASIVFAPI